MIYIYIINEFSFKKFFRHWFSGSHCIGWAQESGLHLFQLRSGAIPVRDTQVGTLGRGESRSE